MKDFTKLPNSIIEKLDQVETLGEMKVILYVIRHTVGFQDDCKKITLDEFANGRKRADGTRLDNGTGLTVPTIRDGLKRAQAHGFLVVEVDDSDPARVKHYFSLGTNLLPSECKEVSVSVQEVCNRTEKDTLERHFEKDTLDIAPEAVTAGGKDPPRRSRKRGKSKPGTPAAVLVFRQNAHRYPAKSWYSDVADTVGDDPADLDFFGSVVKAWVGRGYNPVNIEGMLDCYKARQLPGNGRGQQPPAAAVKGI